VWLYVESGFQDDDGEYADLPDLTALIYLRHLGIFRNTVGLPNYSRNSCIVIFNILKLKLQLQFTRGLHIATFAFIDITYNLTLNLNSCYCTNCIIYHFYARS